MEKKSGLGRGLGSLIPNRLSKTQIFKQATSQGYSYPEAKEEIQLVPVDKVKANPQQPRQDFAVEGLEELVSSIKEHGILQPLILSLDKGDYQLIAGERRLRAAKMLDLKTVPAIVRSASEQQKLELSLVENLQRQDLNPIEEAQAYERLVDEFNLSQEVVAQRVGKKRSTIANTLRLLNLPSKVRQALKTNKISVGHAKLLLELEDENKQLIALKQIISQGYTTRETQTRLVAKLKISSLAQTADPQTAAWEEELRQKLNTKVSIKKQGAKGKIVMEFYSLEELKELINKILKGK